MTLPRYKPWLSSGALQPVFTSDGGLAVPFINKTGAASVRGSVVRISPAVDGAVKLAEQDKPDPMGAIYEDGIPDGGLVRVVVAGVADVLLVNAATRGNLCRIFVAADADFEAGKAKAEAFPTSPFATDNHFCEIGHCIETTAGAGLCRVVLHFN